MEVSSPLCFCELKVQPIYAGVHTLQRSPDSKTLGPGPVVECSAKLSLRSEHPANSTRRCTGRVRDLRSLAYTRLASVQARQQLVRRGALANKEPRSYTDDCLRRRLFRYTKLASCRPDFAAYSSPPRNPWYITALMTHKHQCLDNTAQAHASRIQAACGTDKMLEVP